MTDKITAHQRAVQQIDAAIAAYRGETFWQFKFTGAEGHKILHRWCQRLQTDPTFIKALGFTPTGNPLLDPKEGADDASRLAA